MADCGNDGRPACTGMWGVCRSSRAARAPPMYLRHSGPPLRPTQPFLALSAVQSSRYSLPSEHKGVGEGRDKVIRIHSTHRPTNSSYNRRPEDSTSATQIPSPDTRHSHNTTAIRVGARARGTALKRIPFIHNTPTRTIANSKT